MLSSIEQNTKVLDSSSFRRPTKCQDRRLVSSSHAQAAKCISTLNFSTGKIIPNSPADNGRLKIGDRIIRVNDIDITSMQHGDVVKIIKESGLTVQLTVSNNPLMNTTAPASYANEQTFSPTLSSNNNTLNSFPMMS